MTDVLVKNDSVRTKETSDITKVCFVCTGNTCRSPMAAALLNQLGKGKYIASSAGIMASEGDPISAEAVAALEKRGIIPTPENDYRRHTAHKIDRRIMEESDIVIAISSSHAMALLQAFPYCASKIGTLGKNIPDPFMQGQDAYDSALAAIEDCVKTRFLTEKSE